MFIFLFILHESYIYSSYVYIWRCFPPTVLTFLINIFSVRSSHFQALYNKCPKLSFRLKAYVKDLCIILSSLIISALLQHKIKQNHVSSTKQHVRILPPMVLEGFFFFLLHIFAAIQFLNLCYYKCSKLNLGLKVIKLCIFSFSFLSPFTRTHTHTHIL